MMKLLSFLVILGLLGTLSWAISSDKRNQALSQTGALRINNFPYPSWFSDPSITSDDRQVLIDAFNDVVLRQWDAETPSAGEIVIPIKGVNVDFSELTDLFQAFAGLAENDTAPVNSQAKKVAQPYLPKGRDSSTDQPASAETADTATSALVDPVVRGELRQINNIKGKYIANQEMIPDPNDIQINLPTLVSLTAVPTA